MKESADKTEHIRNPEETKRRLLAAGLSVFSRKGYAVATVDEIVAEAGCSKGAFYCHFGSKDELFLTILANRLERNYQNWRELYPGKENCREWIQNIIETMAGFAERDPAWRALAVEFMAHSMRDPRVGQRLAEMHQRFRQMILEQLYQSKTYRSGRMAVDPELIAFVMGGLLDGVVIHCSLELENWPITQTVQRLRPLLAAWFPEECEEQI